MDRFWKLLRIMLFVGVLQYLTLCVANTIPIWGKTPQMEWIDVSLTANTTKDLTSGTINLVFTADATNGSYLQRLRIRAKGTNVATVMRIFINNGGATGTAANNCLLDEITLPATTLSEVAALASYEVPMNIAMPAAYRIYVTIGTAVAAGFMVSGHGAKY